MTGAKPNRACSLSTSVSFFDAQIVQWVVLSCLSRAPCIALHTLQKLIHDTIDVTADHYDVVQSKPLLDSMRNAVPGMENTQYGNHLRTVVAVRDQMHILGTRTVGIYRKIVCKTQPVHDTYHKKRAKMKAWLDKLFDCTSSTINWVEKRPTLDQHFRD